MLDFRIDTFLAVCRHMNFTKAAEELSITQPAVSQHIRALEENYGVRLFGHKGKKIHLTPAGQLFLNAVTTVKHDDIFLRETLLDIQEAKNKLVFGATRTVGDFLLPEKLAAFLRRAPDARINMVVANTSELLKKLDGGEIDFAVAEGFFERSEYDSLLFSRENYIAVCGSGYPLPQSACVVEELLSCRLLIREAGSGTREILEHYLEGRNLTVRDFKSRLEASSISAIKALARENGGVTFLYEAAVQEELSAGTLRKILLQDFPLTHDITFLWRRGSIFAEHYYEIFRELVTV